MMNSNEKYLTEMIHAYYVWMETVTRLEKGTGIRITTNNTVSAGLAGETFANEVTKKMIAAEMDAGRSSRLK